MKPQDAIHVQDFSSLNGKAALLTGGSRGIGLMIARGLLEAGAKVYLSSRKKEPILRNAFGPDAER
jgi:NAD(P)-dependent dehydrogenase (short-subunit alcohol dehydrogenase family)